MSGKNLLVEFCFKLMGKIKCLYCNKDKLIVELHSKKMCSICRQERTREAAKRSHINNKVKEKEYNRIYHINNKEKISARHKKNYLKRYEKKHKLKSYKPKTSFKISRDDKNKYYHFYYLRNKKKKLSQAKTRHYYRLKTDPVYKLKNIISSSINKILFKNGFSILQYLPYTIQQLKDHLQSLFEPWMTWENHGVYRISSWKDDDSSTWKWHIDHIIPHASFNYSSMEDQSFKDCWSLNNLRPYSAKQNQIDGARKNKIDINK